MIFDFREGFIYVWKSVPMRSTIMLLALVSLMGMPYQVLMPILAKQVLGGGPHTYRISYGSDRPWRFSRRNVSCFQKKYS